MPNLGGAGQVFLSLSVSSVGLRDIQENKSEFLTVLTAALHRSGFKSLVGLCVNTNLNSYHTRVARSQAGKTPAAGMGSSLH